MFDEKDIIEKLKESLSPKRYLHTLGVSDTAVELAKVYGVDVEKAKIAGLLHDCAKDISYGDSLEICKKYNVKADQLALDNRQLIHGPVGSVIAKEKYGVEDKMILDAIYYHTITRESMSDLEKVICVADYTEPNRKLPMVDEIRKLSYENIDLALIQIFKLTINHLKKEGNQIHPAKIKALRSLENGLK